LTANPELGAYFAADMKRLTARTSEIQKRFQALEVTPGGLVAQEKLAAVRKQYLATRDALMGMDAVNQKAAVKAKADEFKALVDDYIKVCTELVEFEDARSKSFAAQVKDSMGLMQVITIAASLACAVIAAVLGWLLSRAVVGPLAQGRATADRIAGGDLSQDLHADSRDSVSRVTESLGKMQAALRTLSQKSANRWMASVSPARKWPWATET